MSKIPYASAIGSIMYVMLCTRPDVSYALSITSRYQSDPGESHWTAAKNILKYLRRSKDMFLVYDRLKDDLVVNGYTDAIPLLGYGQNIQSDWNINAAKFKIFYPLTHQGSHAFHKNRRKGKRNLPLVDRFVKPSKSASWFIRIFKGAAFLKSDHLLQVSTHEQIINDLVEC